MIKAAYDEIPGISVVLKQIKQECPFLTFGFFSAAMRVHSFEKCSYIAAFVRRRVVASVAQDLGRIGGFAMDLSRDRSIIVAFHEDIEERQLLVGLVRRQ